MRPTFNISPQPAYDKAYAETVHNNVTVNSSGDTTIWLRRARRVELQTDLSAWSNGTSDTATIQFTLTRIRPDGSESGSVVGPVMSTLGVRKFTMGLNANDSVKVSWVIAGGTTSYPVMKTTVGSVAAARWDRHLRTTSRPKILAVADSVAAESRTDWVLSISTDADDQFYSFSNGYLELTTSMDTEKEYGCKMKFGAWPSKLIYEADVSFGTSATGLDHSDPPTDSLLRLFGFYNTHPFDNNVASRMLGFSTSGAGYLEARVGTSVIVQLVQLQPSRKYSLKMVVSEYQVEWYIDGYLKYAASTRGLNLPRILQGDLGAGVYKAVGELFSGYALPNAVYTEVYGIRVYSDDDEHLYQDFGTRKKVSRIGAVVTPLIVGRANAQHLFSIGCQSTDWPIVAMRRLNVMGNAVAAAATIIQFRALSSSGIAGTAFPTEEIMWRRSPRGSIHTTNDGIQARYSTAATIAANGNPFWAGIPGAQLSAANASSPTQLQAIKADDPWTWQWMTRGSGIGGAGTQAPSVQVDVTTNDVDWRFLASCEWEDISI